MYSIYCHVFPNGKRYVGLTKADPVKRWNNGKGYKSCPLVNRAIEKYGWENIEHEILYTTSIKEDAEEKEKEFISFYDTLNPLHGYNLLAGGDVSDNAATPNMRYKLGTGWRGKTRSEEDKLKISVGVKKRFDRPESNGHIGLKASGEAKRKMSISHKKAWENSSRRKEASERMSARMSDEDFRNKVLNNLAHCRRKAGEWNMSEEAKEKLSKSMKGRWIGENSPTSKPVLQYTKDGQFIKRWANAGEVERAGIAKRNNISKCCRKVPHCHTAGGFVWRFERDI